MGRRKRRGKGGNPQPGLADGGRAAPPRSRRRLFLAVAICTAGATISSIGVISSWRNGGAAEEARQPGAQHAPVATGSLPARSAPALADEPPVAPTAPADRPPATPPAQGATPRPQGAQGPQPDPVAAARAEIVRLRAEAIEIAKNVIRDYPNRTDALGLLGMVHNRCNEPLEALRCWEQAASRNPNRPDLFQAMARVAVRIGEYDKAAALCRRGLALSSQIPFLHCTLGEALIGLGNPAEAVGELKQATALSSGDGKSYYLLGKAYYLLEDWEQARANYEMAVGLQPGNQAVHYGLGMVYAKLGLEDQSRRSMDQYQKLQADSMEVERRGRGVAYDVATYRRIVATTCSEAAAEYAGEKNDKSEQLLRRGAQVDPTDTACRIKLAMLLVQTGRAPEAIPVCKELSGIEPKNPRHYMGLCRLYAKLQRFDDALVAAQKAAELAPDNGECRRLLEQFQGRK